MSSTWGNLRPTETGGRYLSTYLYNVTPSDPLATAAAVLSMLAVALLSGWWPARAAASLDPMRALRHD